MIILRQDAGRCRLANVLIQEDGGTYFNEQGGVKTSIGIQYTKCKAWRLDPFVKAPRPEASTGAGTMHDGEGDGQSSAAGGAGLNPSPANSNPYVIEP